MEQSLWELIARYTWWMATSVVVVAIAIQRLMTAAGLVRPPEDRDPGGTSSDDASR